MIRIAESGVADVPQENAPEEAAAAAIWVSPPQPVFLAIKLVDS